MKQYFRNNFQGVFPKGLKSKILSIPSSRLVFYHVPKTAGNSLTASLQRVYKTGTKSGKRGHFRCSPSATSELQHITGRNLTEIREQELLMALYRPRNRFITGHFAYSALAQRHYREGVVYVSLLRDPVARFLSMYFFNRYKKSDHFRVDCSLDAFIEAGENKDFYLNWFGRDEQGLIGDIDARYDRALVNLKSLDVVGVVEQMPVFIERLESKLGVRVPMASANKNPRKNYLKEVTPDQQARIEQLCETDLRLYRAICEL